MDIAAIGTQLNTVGTQVSAGVSLTKKAMDVQEIQANGLIDMLNQAVPSFGHKLDLSV